MDAQPILKASKLETFVCERKGGMVMRLKTGLTDPPGLDGILLSHGRLYIEPFAPLCRLFDCWQQCSQLFADFI